MVASTMASTETGLDMVMTGHSLGRNKLEHLLATGATLAATAPPPGRTTAGRRSPQQTLNPRGTGSREGCLLWRSAVFFKGFFGSKLQRAVSTA